MKLKDHQIRSVLFLDIETVSRAKSFNDLDETWQELWTQKHNTFFSNDESPEVSYQNRAAIYAEFGKVICVSLGFFSRDKESGEDVFRTKSFFESDEKALLRSLASLMNKSFPDHNDWQLCGHNVREFDVPYLCRRMMANGVPLPDLLDISGRKPWELNVIDTMQLWKFGDYKNFTSLKLMAATFGIPSPKDDIEGKDVGRVYWHEKDMPRIVNYCQRDVVTVARILLKMRNEKDELGDEDVLVLE